MKLTRINNELYLDVSKISAVLKSKNKWHIQIEGQVIALDVEDCPNLLIILGLEKE